VVAQGTVQLLGGSAPALPGSVGSGAGVAMVRPESVRLTPDPSGDASVLSVAFLGPISRVHCTMPDGSMITAQLPSSEAAAFAPQERVTVGVAPTGVLVVEG
jgi:putative spermidine/putrescine transport system ATP-binding protein